MNEDVLREFMVSLGFKVDETSLKKFNTAVEKVSKGVMAAGVAVAATATGIVAGVAVISSQMEKLYYASQRTGETVGNIMALRYAAAQVGLSADQAQSSLEGFSRALRLSPGTNNLLSSLGVTGDGPAAKFDSFIEKMKEQKPYVAAAYASLFGIDADTLLMLEQGHDKVLADEQRYRDKLAAFGINPEQAADAGKDFNNSIRDVKDTFNDLWIVIESKLAPVLTPLVSEFERWAETHAGEVAQGIADAVQSLANWIQSVDWKKVGNDIHSVFDALGGVKGILAGLVLIQLMPMVTAVSSLASALLGLATAGKAVGAAGLMKLLGPLALLFHSGNLNAHESDDLKKRRAGMPGYDADGNLLGGGGTDSQTAPSRSVASDKDARASGDLFSSLESRYQLPNGLLDSDWDAESRRGKKMLSPKGAQGHFGFMPNTAKEYGLNDPSDLAQSAQAAAHKFADLMQHYAGNLTKAIAGYNWGEGNLDKDIGKFGGDWLKHVPKETSDYVARVTGGMSGPKLGQNSAASGRSMTITQKTDIHVAGTSDPHGTARSVGNEQSRVNGDLARNFGGAYI